MMGKQAQYEMPAALREAQQRFEEWRSSQPGRRPIPDPLWRSQWNWVANMEYSERPRRYDWTRRSS